MTRNNGRIIFNRLNGALQEWITPPPSRCLFSMVFIVSNSLKKTNNANILTNKIKNVKGKFTDKYKKETPIKLNRSFFLDFILSQPA